MVGNLRQFRKKLDETAADLTMTEPKDVDVDKLVAQVVHMLESKLPGINKIPVYFALNKFYVFRFGNSVTRRDAEYERVDYDRFLLC